MTARREWLFSRTMQAIEAMRILVLSCALALTSLGLFAQSDVVMTLGNEQVSIADFEAIFKKNNRDSVISKADLDEYMELFINFKLKVAEARSRGMDTVPAFVSELQGYRRQLTRPYLTDGELLDEMVRDAYMRKTEEVRASHILISCELKASPEDTLKAWNKIMKLRNRIMAGEDFESVARGVGGSEDPSVAQNGGDLGYFSVFQMVYPFENAAFTTEVGQVSMPVRTRFGYHLLDVVDRRDARGELRAAHIMVRADEKDSESVKQGKAKIDNIYSMLQGGADFQEMALKFSEDASTARNGGELPWFGSGKMIESFENTAFGLAQDGDVSEPVQTSVGFHIIKRLEYKPVAAFEEVEKEIRNRVRRDARAEATRASFVRKIGVEYGYEVSQKALKKAVRKNLDTAVWRGNMTIAKAKCQKVTLASFADQTFSAQAVVDFLNAAGKAKGQGDLDKFLNDQLKAFKEEKLIAYEDSRLEEKHNDFRLLMNEYRDGILLFELTDELVWSKAVKDTAGMEAFYEQQQANFMWGERLEAGLYGCVSAELAGRVSKRLDAGVPPNEIVLELNEGGPLNVRYEEGLYERGINNVVDAVEWTPGVSDVFERDGKFWVVVAKSVRPAEPKALDEARGLITAEYQNYLEDRWIKELRAKYNYVVNNDVLYTLITQP